MSPHLLLSQAKWMLWSILFALVITSTPSAASTVPAPEEKLRDGDEFANNLLSDLAPLLALFGERFAQQFMSISTSWLESIIFAIAPLGVITAIVGAIRVGGPRWLRNLIGRARETRAAAEVELMSSTSHEVCEIWNGDAIVRVMGSPRIQQLLFFQGLSENLSKVTEDKTCEDAKSKLETFGMFTLEEAAKQNLMERKPKTSLFTCYKGWRKGFSGAELLRYLLRKHSNSDGEDGEAGKPPPNEEETQEEVMKEAPNISLNIAGRAETWELALATIFGLLVQIAVLVVTGIITYHQQWSFKKGGITVQKYSYPLNAAGTLLLVVGMFISASVIEKSTHEERWIKTGRSRKAKLFIIWLQRGRVINDQTFDSFALITKGPVSVVSTSRRRRGDKTNESHFVPFMHFFATLGTVSSVVGFIMQFMGLRGMHWSASTAQLSATVLMTIVRALLRREISKRPSAFRLAKEFELEWLSTALAKHEGDFGTYYSNISRQYAKNDPPFTFRVVTVRDEIKSLPRDTQQSVGQDTKGLNVGRIWPIRCLMAPRIHSSGHPCEEPSDATVVSSQLIKIRQRLGKLSQWTCPASDAAIATTNAIEVVMNILFPSRTDPLEWSLDIHCNVGDWSGDHMIQLTVQKKSGSWSTSASEIEAVLSLWLQYARKLESKRQAPKVKDNSMETEWLRREPRKQNMRFLGPDTIPLRRDLRWWVPHGATSLLEVTSAELVIDIMHTAQAEPGHYIIDYHRITGLHAPVIQSVSQCSPDRSWESNPPVAVRFGCSAVSLDELGTAGKSGEGTQGTSGDSPTNLKETSRDTKKDNARALAIVTSTSTEILFAQHIFAAFMTKVSKELGRIGGESNASQATRTTRPSAWQHFRLDNTVISQIALGIQNAGLAGSLEEAYICIIPPLSLHQKLPVGAVVDMILKNIEKYETVHDWAKCAESYGELLDVCKEFCAERCPFTTKATMAAVEYMRRIDDMLNVMAASAENQESNSLKKSKEDLDRRLRAIKDIKYFNILWKGLYKLQHRPEEFKILLPPKAGKTDVPTTSSTDKVDAAAIGLPKDVLEHFGHSELHGKISKGIRHWMPGGTGSKGYVTEQDILGWTPFHYLACQPHYPPSFVDECARYLINHGADPNACDISGRTPLHYAALREKPTIGKILAKQPEVVVNVQARDGTAPLHYAAKRNNELAKPLLEENAQVDVQDNTNRTPLHWAARYNNPEAVHLLLQFHALADIPDIQQRTALHLAIIAGSINCVNALLQESNPEASENNGRTALHLAVLKRKKEIAEILLKKGVQKQSRDNEGHTVLHTAALNGDKDIVCLLLQHNISLLEKCGNEQTVLHLAAQNDHDKVARLLLEHNGVDKQAKDKIGRTPFHIAAAHHVDVIQLFLDHKVEKEIRDNEGNTVLHLATASGREGNVKLLIDNGFNTDAINNAGESPLHIACSQGNISITTLLLCHESRETINASNNGGRTPINAKNLKGRTALHHASKRGHDEVVKLLLDYGAQVDLQDQNGNTALHITCVPWRNTGEIPKILLQHDAMANIQNEHGHTALHYAAMKGDSNLVQLLLKKNASVNIQNSEGETALHFAVEKGDPKLVQLFLEKKARVNIQNNKGETALHSAARLGDSNLVQLLLKGSASVARDITNRKGQTALHLASKTGREEVVKSLVGVDSRGSIDVQDNNGDTALHLACAGWRPTEGTVTTLIRANAAIVLQNKKGQTPLHSAAKSGQTPLLTLLLEHGANIDSTTSKGRTALHLAAKRGYKDAVKVLVDRLLASSINLQDKNGDTALHLACERGGEEVIETLIEYGASATIQNNDGHNAIHLAVLRDDEEMVERLLRAGGSLIQKNKVGHTPIFLTLASRNRDIIGLMLRHRDRAGQTVNTTTAICGAALHSAITKGYSDIVVDFLDAGADPYALDDHGWTAILCASESHQLGMHPKLTELASMSEATPRPQRPTAWSEWRKDRRVTLHNDELAASVLAPASELWARHLVLANHPLHPVSNNSDPAARYFEIEVLETDPEGIVGLGLCNGFPEHYNRMPGWDSDAWGYHGDDGKKFAGYGWGTDYSVTYGVGDIIGCGVDQNGRLFFTKNGKNLGTAFEDVFGQLFPIVGMAESCRIITNFGSGGRPFKYKFDMGITELQDEVTFGESNAVGEIELDAE